MTHQALLSQNFVGEGQGPHELLLLLHELLRLLHGHQLAVVPWRPLEVPPLIDGGDLDRLVPLVVHLEGGIPARLDSPASSQSRRETEGMGGAELP